jgi:hypothetical protein
MRLEVDIGDPVSRGALSIYPVFNRQVPAAAYLTAVKAQEQGLLKVVERPRAAVVPELVVRNRGTLPILIVEGEMLVGNKQNRTFNVSVLCPPGSVAVPVSCVEEGRWGAARPSRRSRRHAPPGLRARMSRSVVDAARWSRDRAADQHELWAVVADYARRRLVDAPTMALEDVYAAAEPELHDLVRGIAPQAGQSGVVVAVGGRVRLLELFDRPETLRDYWDALLAGYALDAVDADPSAAPPGPDEVADFLRRVREAPVVETESCGLGREIHLRSADVHGTGLTWEGTLVHLCAFNDESAGGGSVEADPVAFWTERTGPWQAANPGLVGHPADWEEDCTQDRGVDRMAPRPGSRPTVGVPVEP